MARSFGRETRNVNYIGIRRATLVESAQMDGQEWYLLVLAVTVTG